MMMAFYQYCLYFIIYSFLGWVYESMFYTFQLKKPVNTGFLYGCFCPIYGVACVANILLLGRVVSNAAVLVISMIAISAIEYAVSYVLEYLFDKRWWDYSDWPCNLNGRISIISSLGFGILSVVQLRVLHPFIDMFVSTIPDNTAKWFIAVTVSVLFVDLMWTVKRMDKAGDKLWFIDEEAQFIHHTNERFSKETRRISDRYTDICERIKNRIHK